VITAATAITGVTGVVKGKLGSKSDIDSGEYTDPSPSASIGLNVDTSEIEKSLSPIRDSAIRDSTKASPKTSIGIGIGRSPQGNLGIGVEVPIPVPAPISGRGGVSIDPSTGEIRGGYGGLGIGKGPIGASVDVGVDTPIGSEKTGCFKYVTFSALIFSHTYGKNECEPKKQEEKPKPPGANLPPGALSPSQIDEAMLTTSCGTVCVTWVNFFDTDWENPYPTGREGICYRSRPVYNGYAYTGASVTSWASEYDYYIHIGEDIYNSLSKWFKNVCNNSIGTSLDYFLMPESTRTQCFPVAPSPSSPPSSYSPPIPNPPPTRKKMQENCCQQVLILQLETLRMLGRQVVNGKLVPISGTAKGFLGEEIERTKTPIKDVTNPEIIKIKFNTIYELLAYSLAQANNLDTALDPQSYKPPTGYLQNPEYNRDTEESLKNNRQPGTDKSGNKRQLRINKDEKAKFSGFIQQQSYVFEAIKRLEYLFPSGELDDAKIAKGLLIPGQNGDIKIHNMIQAYELQMQYLNAILGNPREEVTIKDANPAIKGDQPMKFKALSMSELLRESIKFQIDTAGDLDALVNMVLRDFRTNLANRITSIQTAEMVTALFEDSGMLEDQDYIKVNLEGDPYAGQWVQGKGFEPNPELDKNTEEATEKVLEATLKNFTIKIKVSRRDKKEKTDMRDLLRGLADFVQRLLSVPASGDAVNKLIQDAKFKVQTDMALIRENVKQAATASRNRTRKRKK
jgi:hypothetical protein